MPAVVLPRPSSAENRIIPEALWGHEYLCMATGQGRYVLHWKVVQGMGQGTLQVDGSTSNILSYPAERRKP